MADKPDSLIARYLLSSNTNAGISYWGLLKQILDGSLKVKVS
jgi:hypothetical protein